MASFKELANNVKTLKAEIAALYDEKYSTPSRERHEAVQREINVKTNELYDAVNYLCDYINEETGINAYAFKDLLSSNGYVMGAGIERPKTLAD